MSKLPLGIVPRMLSREQAAEYCGCESLSAFDEWRHRGIIPGPMSGTTKWDRKLIDRWLDRRSGLISDPGPSIDEWLAQQADEPPAMQHEDPFFSGIEHMLGKPRGSERESRSTSSRRRQVDPQSDPSQHVVLFSDVARELGVSATTLRKLCNGGKGPPLIRLSERRLGVRRGELDAWIETCKVVP